MPGPEEPKARCKFRSMVSLFHKGLELKYKDPSFVHNCAVAVVAIVAKVRGGVILCVQ